MACAGGRASARADGRVLTAPELIAVVAARTLLERAAGGAPALV
jgi:hypothetical protein